jgi:hypothetical protein
MEFVNNSSAISSILAEHKKDIGKYLSTHNQSPRALAESVDVFVKSCAGYCVITYLLGTCVRGGSGVFISLVHACLYARLYTARLVDNTQEWAIAIWTT